MLRFMMLPVVLLLAASAVPLDYTNEAAFKARFNADVITPYTAAIANYNALLTALNAQLANYDPKNVQSLMKPVDPALLQASQQFLANITVASTGANQTIQEIDAQMTTISNQISQTNSQITQLNGEIQKTQSQIQGTQTKVQLAQTALNNAQANLATREQALQDAINRLSDARRRCLQKRRKRDIWKKIGHAIKDVGKTIEHAICEVAGHLTGDIESDKGERDQAQAALNNAQATFNQQNQELAKQQTTLHQQQTALQGQQAQLATLQGQLNALKVKRDQINALDKKMKDTLTFVDSMMAKGQVVKHDLDLGFLLDINNIVVPLAEVGQHMASLNGQSAAGQHLLPSLSNDQIAALKQKIDQIEAHTKG